MDQHVIVIGKNYLTTLGVVRSLSKAGYRINVVYITSRSEDAKILSSSKYVEKLVVINERDDEKIIDALIYQFDTKENQYILFPTDDFSSSCIDKFSDKLNNQFLMQHVIDGTVTQMMDKSIQSILACKAGLNTAEEWVISLDADQIDIPSDIVYPCFLKPLLSAKGGKSGLYKCDTREELTEKLQMMQKRMRNRSVLVQEFLTITDEYTMGGVCNDQDVFIPAIIKKKVVAKSNRGVTLCGTIISEDEIKDSMPAIMKFLKSVRFVGMFDLEIMMTDKGIYFGELNLRCGGPSYSYDVCGVNLTKLAVHAICGKDKMEKQGKVVQDKVFINDKVAWEDYSNLYLSKNELKTLYKECDFSLISNSEDIGPENVFCKIKVPMYKKKRIQNSVKKRLHPISRLIKRGLK